MTVTKQQQNNWIKQFLRDGTCPHGCGTKIKDCNDCTLAGHVIFCRSRFS